MKKCSGCQTERDESEFTREARKKDGLSAWCRVCKRNHARKVQTVVRQDDDNKARRATMARVTRLVESGVIQKPTACPSCNKTPVRMHAHLDDTSDPRSVRWRCVDCFLLEVGKRIPRICLWCSEPFSAQRSQVRSPKKKGGGRYCSAKCRSEWMAKTAEHITETPPQQRSNAETVYVDDRF